ncbi:FecCD family ABC transporter permease [Corynebacterium uberis]|uniref:FecCD family ABC transporter permease n=1 Tax=Corynebacterium TaxID=1716 RepID=UPI001D0A5EE1|nr:MULTISPECIES: iron ABC transporter permease [Corynebacterium]MCZ9309823.1 iron ABC transporter permease [Corynebacterium sp. c6VSa_13]UDL73621.1 iron ABC transporter permease [Corynebacterium uberis]UDL75499.1 iron ABC transporter permease [Corynebacterium uberis]UDL77712.1 iron ABC transporter permease [Corynebacterium uberis]UDL79996.1 iron ABC transporter permease [Corynebacterium uberis]
MARRVTLIVLLVALVVSLLANLALGQFVIPLGQLIDALVAGPSTDLNGSVLWQIRLPRIVLGIIVGAALAVAGTLLQGLFGNPLAEPSVIGVTSGAGVGAAVGIVFGLHFLGLATIPILAFVAGIGTSVAVYRLASIGGKVRVISLILTGIAVNAVAGAMISILIFLAPTTARDQIIFWQMGSLNGALWPQVLTAAVPVVVCLIAACVISRQLDVLALGERAAEHAGVNVAFLRVAIIGLSTALAAAAVSFAGIIGFVGLIVPHILRQAMGPSNTWLVPMSALGGAVLVTASDLAARVAIPYADLPIGVFTALVGGPTFFILLRRSMR